MNYKLKNAKLLFDKDGKLESITTTAEMPGNCKDVRMIQAVRKNYYWTGKFDNYDSEIQKILQFITANGSQIETS